MLRLLLLQVLASCLWLGHSEVVNSSADCSGFFYEGFTPNNALEPANPVWICQRYKNQYRFATLYDKTRRIPVYSAYIYQPGSGNRPQSWFVEPQLIGNNQPKEMETVQTVLQRGFTIDDIKQNQAVLEDYDNLSGLDRGHLSPCGHQDNFNNRSATFTLTNIVPQDSNLNSGAWRDYELKTMAKTSKGCKTTYVITGAVPGNNMVKNRVNVPSHIWSAACCLMGTTPGKAWGVIAKNQKNQKFPLLTLGQLETDLSQLYGGNQVTLFHSACPR